MGGQGVHPIQGFRFKVEITDIHPPPRRLETLSLNEFESLKV